MGYNSFNLFLFTALLFSCNSNTETKKQPAAEVTSPVTENSLTTITLSPQAEKNLGIKTITIGNKQMQGMLNVGGEVQAEPGHFATVTSPMRGTLTTQKGADLPQPGKTVKKGEILYRLVILPAEGELTNNKQELEMRKIQLTTAQAKTSRMRQLLKDGAVSVRAKQEAEAELAVAQKAYQDALGKLQLLQGSAGRTNNLSVFTIKAPFDGVIQQAHVGSPQTVAANAPLLDIAGLSPVWIRVPVYMGDLEKLDRERPAQIQSLASARGQTIKEAKPVSAPVATTSGAAQTYLFYELPNTDKAFYPGEKVKVSLYTKDLAEGLVIPYSAIVYDINGGEWIYEQTAPQVYQRHRVEVQAILGQQAIISRGVKKGMKVVTVGVTELFGTEFGGSK